jgi:Flp pilus assembly protein TadG
MRNFTHVLISARKNFKAFRKDHRGSITTIAAVASLPMMLAAGAAIDTIRADRERVAFDAAVDSAALAVAADDRASLQGLSTTQKNARIAELETYAKKYLAENYTSQYGSDPITDVDIEITGSTIDLTSHHAFPTTIMSLTGIDEINLTSHAQVMKAMRPIELVMVMDTTGSMGTTYMAQAKVAAHDLLKTLYAGTPAQVPESEFIRTALVPFSAAVRLNKNAYDFNLGWIDTTGANPLSKLNFTNSTVYNNYTAWGKLKSNSSTYMSWNGCVEARARGTAGSTDYIVNDVAPTSSTPATLFPAFFYPDDATVGTGTWNNEYIGNYSPDNQTPPATGWENSTLGKNSTLGTASSTWGPRVLNQEKYTNKVLTAESLTSASDGPWNNCAKAKVVPMTHKRANVEAGIDAMFADGNTNVAEGLAWGWRVISPGEPFAKVEGTSAIPASTISPYNDVRWQKIAVLMTDGENNVGTGISYSGSSYGAYGRGSQVLATNRYGTTSSSSWNSTLDTNMATICTSMKAKGITIYATGFNLSNSAADTLVKNRLKACASPGTAYYSDSANGVDLQAFFNHIGEDVLNKSIYVSK